MSKLNEVISTMINLSTVRNFLSPLLKPAHPLPSIATLIPILSPADTPPFSHIKSIYKEKGIAERKSETNQQGNQQGKRCKGFYILYSLKLYTVRVII